MGKIYIGANDIARSVKKIYTGVNNIAREVKKIYIGDVNGIARLVYSSFVLPDLKANILKSSDSTNFQTTPSYTDSMGNRIIVNVSDTYTEDGVVYVHILNTEINVSSAQIQDLRDNGYTKVKATLSMGHIQFGQGLCGLVINGQEKEGKNEYNGEYWLQTSDYSLNGVTSIKTYNYFSPNGYYAQLYSTSYFSMNNYLTFTK